MEYFAKSKKRELSIEERKKLQKLFEKLQIDLQSELQEWEKNILYQAQQRVLNQSKEEQKTLRQHLEETEHCAEQFFQQYGQYFDAKEKILILTACRYHDIGKANNAFQSIVNPNIEKKIKNARQKNMPHGYLSAVSISGQSFLQEYSEMTEDDFYSMITAIYHHHTRDDKYLDIDIREYSKKYYEESIKKFLGQPAWKVRMKNRRYLLFTQTSRRKVEESKWNQYVLIKGMLNKFDWIVSAGYEQAEMEPDLIKKELKANIEKNRNLRPVQVYMKAHKDDNLIIIAPTGSGKTEAALLWLDGEKGFYTLPLKVSSNAIYDRIKDRYCFKDVSLLHSDSAVKYLQEFSVEKEDLLSKEMDGYIKYERAKLLSAPLTICTVDQLFKFVYKALGTEIFAATLKYSKIILDEIQAYSPRIIATLIYGLRTISEMGGRFAIITATFPPVLESFMKKYGLMRNKEYKFCNFCGEVDLLRHKIVMRTGEMDTEEIIRKAKQKKVLIICNTVTKAQEVYDRIREEGVNEVFLLHSRYLRRDKTLLEDKINQFSQCKEAKGIWITTQIVEASLDIDFDILYTEMCSADSLLQRMGRCNRAGRYFPEQPNIIIFNNENGKGTIYDKEIYERSVKYLSQYENIVFTEKVKIDYINQVYNEEEIKETAYYQEIEECLKYFEEIKPLDYELEQVNKKFRSINSITIIPDSIYDQYSKFFDVYSELKEEAYVGKEVRTILNAKLQELTVNLNLYSSKYPERVDYSVIKGTNIHRSSLSYEFDPIKCIGKGLSLKREEDEQCFF